MKWHYWIAGFLASTSLLCLWIIVLYDSKRLDKLEQRPRVAASLKEVSASRIVGQAATGVDLIPEMEGKDSRSIRHPQAGIESGQQPKAILAQETLHLEHLVSESLHGKINVNDWMDTIAEFAQFEVNPLPVEGWRDDSVTVHEFLLGAENVHAYLEVDKEQEGRYGLRVESGNHPFVAGASRRSFDLVLYFETREGNLEHFAAQSYAKVELGYSRRIGVEAYRGSFQEGIIYQNGQAFSFGISNGHPTKFEEKVSGDLNLDPERVRLLYDRVKMLLGELGK